MEPSTIQKIKLTIKRKQQAKIELKKYNLLTLDLEIQLNLQIEVLKDLLKKWVSIKCIECKKPVGIHPIDHTFIHRKCLPENRKRNNLQ